MFSKLTQKELDDDPKLRQGAIVHALARHVTNSAECQRLFGSKWKKARVRGEVLSACKKEQIGRFFCSTDSGRSCFAKHVEDQHL